VWRRTQPIPSLTDVSGSENPLNQQLAYARTLQNGFIRDDSDYVTSIQSLRTTQDCFSIWTDRIVTPEYCPVGHTSFGLSIGSGASGQFPIIRQMLFSVRLRLLDLALFFKSDPSRVPGFSPPCLHSGWSSESGELNRPDTTP